MCEKGQEEADDIKRNKSKFREEGVNLTKEQLAKEETHLVFIKYPLNARFVFAESLIFLSDYRKAYKVMRQVALDIKNAKQKDCLEITTLQIVKFMSLMMYLQEKLKFFKHTGELCESL